MTDATFFGVEDEEDTSAVVSEPVFFASSDEEDTSAVGDSPETAEFDEDTPLEDLPTLGEDGKPLSRQQGESPVPLVSKDEARAKGEMGITEAAQNDYEAATGADAPDNPVLAQVANMGLSVGGKLGANLQMKAAQRLVSDEEMSDGDVDSAFDMMQFGVAAPFAATGRAIAGGFRSRPSAILHEWDETEGRRIADPGERGRARRAYAAQIASDFVKERTAVKQNARTESAARERTHGANIVTGGLAQLGYTAPYILGPAGIAAQFLEEGAANAVGYANDEYGYDEQGRFRLAAKGDDAGRAALAGFGTAGIETAAEVALGRLGGAVVKRGGKMFLAGAGGILSKVPFAREIGGKVAATRVGKAVGAFAGGMSNAFKWTNKKLHLGGFGEENLEEYEGAVLNALTGWDRRASELVDDEGNPTTALSRFVDANKEFFSPKNMLELNEAMLITMGGGLFVAKCAQRRALRNVDNLIRENHLMSEEELGKADLEAKAAALDSYLDNLTEAETVERLDRANGWLGRFTDAIAGDKGKFAQEVTDLRCQMDEYHDRMMGEELDRLKVPRQQFSIPTRTDADGKTVPDFKAVLQRDAETGRWDTYTGVIDADSGITLTENGVSGASAYTVHSPDGRKSQDFATLDEAVEAATRMKNELALDHARDELKRQYIANTVKSQFGGATVVDVKTAEEAVKAGVEIAGVDVSKNKDYDPSRRAWKLPDGTVVLVRDNLHGPAEVETVLRHEIVGHGEAAMDDGFMGAAERGNEGVRTRKAYGVQMGAGEERALREAVANTIQRRSHHADSIDKLVHGVRNALRRMGVDLKMNDADFETEVARMEREIREGGYGLHESKPMESGSAFSEAAQNETAQDTGAQESGKSAEQTAQETAQETAQPAENAAQEAAAPTQPEEAATPTPEQRQGDVAETATPSETRKPVAERTVVEKMTDEAPVVELDTAEVSNDDTRIPNFKEGANPETGEVDPLRGEPYDLVSNPIVVMEFKDGKKVVVTGRHRLALYKRSGRAKIAARVIREADGWTVDDAKSIDAIANIIDEKGSVKDYVRYFDGANPTREEAESGGFLARPKGRLAFGIVEGATADTRGAIDFEGSGAEGQITPEQAGIIAEAAPKDAHPRFGAVQKILVRQAAKGLRGTKLKILARSLAEEVRARKDAPKQSGEVQLDLFTSEEDVELLRLEERRADYRAKKANEYRRVAENLRTAMRKGGKLDLNAEYARELGITDPKDRAQLKAARDRAAERAHYWEEAVRLDDADKAAMDAELGVKAADGGGKTEGIEKKSQNVAEKPPLAPEKSSEKPVQAERVQKNGTHSPEKTDGSEKSVGRQEEKKPESADFSVSRIFVIDDYGEIHEGRVVPEVRKGGKTRVEYGGRSRLFPMRNLFTTRERAENALAERRRIGEVFDGVLKTDAKENAQEVVVAKSETTTSQAFDAEVMEAMRRSVKKVGTADLERHVKPASGYRSEYVAAAKEELERRRAAENAPAAAPQETEATAPAKAAKPAERKEGAFRKPSPKTPSVRMKDEAAERLAQRQEDELAALFDSPELDADGTIVSGDEVRKTMPGYDRLDWSTHVDRTGYVGPRLEAQFQRLLKERKGKGDGTVVFLAGGNGAGKSTVAAKLGTPDFTIDSTLGNPDVAKRQIDAILANGQTPVIHFVYRAPGQALEGIKNRVKNGGHIVSPLSFANSHVKSRENLRLLSEAYGDKLPIHIYDNSVAGAPEITLEQLEAKRKPDHAKLREEANYYLGHLRDREKTIRDSQGGLAGSGAKGPSGQVDFDSPEFDPDVFQRRVGAVAKLVKTYKESGVADFGTLATRMAERFPEKFGAMKPYLRGVWNAVAEQMGLDEVSRIEAERVYGIIDPQAKEAINEPTDYGRDGGVRAAADGGERPGGILAGGHVRNEDSDERVGSVGTGDVPGRVRGLAESATTEAGASGAGEVAGGNESIADNTGHSGGEREVRGDTAANGVRSAASIKKKAKKAADDTKPNPSRRDFVMTKVVEDAILEKKTAQRVRNNLAAIRLIRDLKARDYAATPEEQETLAKFVGWGGLREDAFGYKLECAYNVERSGATDFKEYLKRQGISQSAYDLHKELRQVLNDNEYESAKASASTAFYTPVEFVRVLHGALRNLGVKGGRFLGPSAGTGNFASAAGDYEKPVNWQFVEKDAMTGEMLKALFPNQRVTVGGFEDTKFPDGFFDFAIDNVPYADVPVNDRSLSSKMFKIHDYFFAKTLAKLRPGGVMAFLTSTGTLDKTSPILRQFLTEHGGRIVGAVRLPNGFFAENAGTDAASDLVIVQKVSGRPDNSAFEKGVEYGKTEEWVRRQGKVTKPLTYNGYFKGNPRQVIGKMEVSSGQFGPTLKYTMPEGDKGDVLYSIGQAVERAFDRIDKDALLKSASVAKPQEVHAPIYDDEGLRQGNVTMKDGKPFIKSGDMLEPVALPNDRALAKELSKRSRSAKGIMDGLIGLRKAMRDVIDAQMSDRDIAETDLSPLFAKLNEVYDAFVKENGSLHDKWVTPFVLLDKADGNRLLALERKVKDENGKPKIVKSDIFTKRVISRGQKATKADTPKDALVVSYSENGGINVPRIAELLGVDADEAVQKLKEGGDVFENPQSGLLEPSWEYLSGRVRAKLAAARAAVDAGEESFRANVEALEKVQPPMVRLEDAEIKFGATWVDPECMKDFLRDAFGAENMRIALGKNEVTGQWNVEFGHVMNEDPWGETSWNPKEFVNRVLNHGSMNHYVTNPVDKTRYLDERRTEANKLAAEKMHHAFSQFIQSSEKWAEPCYERYNAVMTDMVEISLPNNILPFRSAGMSEATLGKLFEGGDPKTPKKGREYQSAVIARGVLGNGSLCLAHCVGAGKTLEMQSIGVLGRHLGLFKKPMYVVPNHMLEQFTNEFVEAFPNANILKMGENDVKPENRRAFFAQVANGDWDAIVVKHSTFSKKLALSDRYQKEFIEAQRQDLIGAIAAMREAGERVSVDQATKKLERLEAKLEQLANAENHDSQIVPFEELGVDQLFVDEAHNFKGMPVTTRQGRTGGLSQGDSQRAVDMQMKTQYVQSLHGGDRGVVFATGTPLSNAPVVEAYVMLKYLAPNKLEEQGLKHFDDFVDAFGRITTESEFSLDGKSVKEKEKVSAFVNIPELMKLLRSVVDIVNPDQLDIPRPKPKYRMIDVDMSPAQESIMEMVAHEAATPPSREERNKYLTLTRIAKNACLTPRLLGYEDGGNKIIRAVAEIKKVYDETADNRGAQLVFTDIFNRAGAGTDVYIDAHMSGEAEIPRSGHDYNLNEEIRNLLVQAGVPKDEIAIIQDIDKSKGDKDANKGALFAKVRSGDVRILIGSRPKMGEGTNVQERLAAIHLLHPGWKPAEDEQAIGRIIRFGNTYKEAQIFYYLTKGNANIGSYETKNHQLIGVKSRLIDQVMHGDDTVREIDMDESVMDRDMLMGLASGNKALMELIDVKKRVHKLELNTESTASSARRIKDKAEANARILERRREEFAQEQVGVTEWREKNAGKPFTLSTPDGRSIEKVKDMAEYVAAQMTKLLTQDRYDRAERTVLGDFNGVEMVLAYDKWGDEKFRLAVPLLGVVREINYSGFIPDFSQAAMTAFKGKILETVSPDFAKAYENSLADMDRQAKKMSADADRLQNDYEGMRGELIKLRTRQAELERAVTPLMVQAVENRKIVAYGNWIVTKPAGSVAYVAQRESDVKRLSAPTVRELIPLMDAEDFASPKNAALKTADLRPRLKPNGKGELPGVDVVSVGDVDFDSPELNAIDGDETVRDDRQLQEIYDIISDHTPEVAAKRLSGILQEIKDGRRRIRPYRAEEIVRGAQGRNHALGVLALAARATGESLGRNAYGGKTGWRPQDADLQETRQRNALVKIAKGLGVYVDSDRLDAMVSDEGRVLGRGRNSTAFSDETDDHVVKVREIRAVADDVEMPVEGGATWDFDDLLLSNAILGKDFDTTLIGVSENNGRLYLILRQPKADDIPTNRSVLGDLREYMTGKGFSSDEFARDRFENADYEVTDLRLGANIGTRNGKIFPFDPIASFSYERRRKEQVLFDSPELSPEEAEYAASEDKTPTEKVMRDVFGMTNEDIETALRAAGMEPPKHVRKPDETAWQQAEALLSNPSYMAKLSRAVAKFPRSIADYENIALNVLFRRRQADVNAAQTVVDELKETLDAFEAIPKGERDADWTEERKKTAKNHGEAKARLAQAKSLMSETGLALERSSSEAGRRLRSNRGLIRQKDYSYAGILNEVAETLGGVDKITPEMDAEIREIAREFASLDEVGRDLATARLKAQAEKIVGQMKRGGKIRKAIESRTGDEAKRVQRNYNDALAQIEVGAAEVGGTLVGLSDQQYPAWGRWLKWIGEFHCFVNPDITEEECIAAIVEDISPFMDGVDANQVRDALTGFGHNFRQSRHEAQRLMNDLRSQSRMKRQIDWMDENNTMPPLTGLVRDEPSDTTRNLQKRVQERKKEVPDAGRDERRLKGVIESAKTRVRNRIADLKRAIETREKIPGRDRTVAEDIELRALRKRKEELQKEYDALFKTSNGMTDEQRVKLAERLLAKELEHALEDLDRARSGDFSKRPRRTPVSSPSLDVLRERLDEVRGEIRALKVAKYEFGMTPEELAAYNARKMASREKVIERLAERVEHGDLRQRKKPQPPMPKEMSERYKALGDQMKKAHRKLAELREEAERKTGVMAWERMKEYGAFALAAQRALKTTIDFSAMLNQAARITLAHPVMAARSFGKAWRAMGSDFDILDVNDEIMSDPAIREAVGKYGLHLREVDAANERDVDMFKGMESQRVKFFGKRVAITDIPFYGQLMLRSERHYITYLNAISAELYARIANGVKGGMTPWQKKQLCDMINIWNGSGAMSNERRQSMQKSGFGNLFFSLPLTVSQIQTTLLQDVFRPAVARGIENEDGGYDEVTKEERTAMVRIGAREHLKGLLALTLLGALIRMVFSDDDDRYAFGEADPVEKFLLLASPKVGDTTLDFSGGNMSIARKLYQIVRGVATGKYRTGTGREVEFGGYGSPGVATIVGRTLQGKAAPWISTVISMLERRDFVGEPYGVKAAALDLVAPMSVLDMYEQYAHNGVGRTLFTAPLTLVGARASTYDRKAYENAVNRFLEAKKEFDSIDGDDLLDDAVRKTLLDNIQSSNPLMRDDVRDDIAADIRQIRRDETHARNAEKKGYEPDSSLLSDIERGKAALLEKIRAARRR